MENDPLDPQTFCRLCLQSSSVYFSLFDNESAHMLQSLTSVKISQIDTSTLACPRCLVELQNAYNTQQRLIKNETFLKEKLEQVEETCDIPQEKPEEPKIPKKSTIDDLLVCSVQTHQNKKVNIYTIRTDVDITANNPNSIESQNEDVNTDDSSTKLDVTSNPDLDGINVEYKCAKCPEKFTVASEYVTHLDTHRVECCKICRQEVPVDQLREHRKSHVSGYCEYCGFTSKSRASLQIHINRNHIDPIECKFCGTVSYVLLNRQHKGRFGLAWIAATRGIQHITKKDVSEVNIGKLCDDICEYVCSQSESPRKRFSLRLSATLVNGTIKIYNQKAKIFYDDLVKMITATSRPAQILVEPQIPLERPDAFKTPPSPIPKKRLKRKRDETERSTPQSEIERLIADVKAMEKEIFFPPEEMVVLQAREEDLTLRESQLPCQIAPNEDLVGGLGDPLTEQELQEMSKLVRDTVSTAGQLLPIEEVSEAPRTTLTPVTPKRKRRRETMSTPSEPETGPVTVTVQAQVHVSADVQMTPVRLKTVEIQPSEVINEAVVERERLAPAEQPEVEEVRPRQVLEEMQVDVVEKKDKKVATRKKKKDDLSKVLVKTQRSRVVRINRCDPEEVDWFDIDPCPRPEFKLISPDLTFLLKTYLVRGDGVSAQRERVPGLENSATLCRKTPVKEGIVSGSIVPEIHGTASVPEVPLTTPVIEETEMIPIVTPLKTSTGKTPEVEQKTVEQLIAVTAEEGLESPRKRRRLIDVQPELPKDLDFITEPSELPSRNLIAKPFTEAAKSVNLPPTSDQIRQQDIMDKVIQGGKLTLEGVCQKPINRLNIARAFNDVLVLSKHEYVTLISEDNSPELKFIDRGPKISTFKN